MRTLVRNPLAPVIAAVVAVLTLTLAASAQSSDEAADVSITGAWSFETDVYETSCQMTGSLTVRATAEDDIYEGDLRTLERCGYYPPEFPGFRAVQRSRLIREGDQLTIRSEVVSVEPDTGGYWPDNFVLTVRASDLMEGQLRSADIAGVRFFRSNPTIS